MAMPYRPVAAWQPPVPFVRRDAVAATTTGAKTSLVAAAVAAALLLAALLITGHGAAPGHAGLVQMAQARFYQDLDWAAARVWQVTDVRAVTWACRLLAVFGCCVALLRIVALLASAEGIGLAAAVLLVGLACLTDGAGFMSGLNLTGGIGLAGGAFTAAQLAVVVVLLSVALVLDGSVMMAVALLGLAFDADPGVAVWGVFSVTGALAAQAWDGAQVGRAWLAGAAGALVLAAPAVLWWWPQITGHAGLPDDAAIATTLLASHPWMLLLAPLQGWVLFGCAASLGLGACSALGPEARAVRGALLGLLAVFALGCLLPFVTGAPWLLGLRPMAADLLAQLVSAAAAAAVIARDVQNPRNPLRVVLSVIVGGCLLLHPYLLPLAALAMLARAAAAHGELLGIERRLPAWHHIALGRVAMATLLVAALGGVVLRCL